MISIKIDKQKEIIENELKNNTIITEDGEIIKLHDNSIESLAKNIIKKEGEENVKDIEKAEEFKKYLKEKTTFQSAIFEKLGLFYFNFYNSIPVNIDRQYIFRFIYLCTYLKYEDNRLQYKPEHKQYRLFQEGDLYVVININCIVLD